MTFNNPYDSSGKWYKGNLHTHTNNSDGELTPEEAVFWYKERGYHFLAITDHDKVTDTLSLSSPDFLVIKGIELGADKNGAGNSYHLVGIGLEETIRLPEGTSAQKAIDFILSQGGEVIIAHPYWSALNVKDLSFLKNYLGLEVFNTGCELEKANGLSRVHWDDLLVCRKQILGFAVDDSHWHIPDAGGGWVMVKAERLTKVSIILAIRKGLFYSSCGPEITDLRIVDNKALIICSPCKIINFICDRSKGGSLQAKTNKLLTEAGFELSGKEEYLRVECIDKEGKFAWTNPIWLMAHSS